MLLGKLHQRLLELVIYRFVYIEPLGQHANLPGVDKRQRGNLGQALGNVHVLADNEGVVAAELEDALLQRLGTACGDELAGADRAGKGYDVDARVLGDPGAEGVVAAEDLEDAGRVDGHGQLAQLEVCVGRVGRGLHDDGVSRHQRSSYFAQAEQDGPVPGHDGGDDAHGVVCAVDDALVVFVKDVVPELYGGKCAEPFQHVVKLPLGDEERLARLDCVESLELFAVSLYRVCVGEHELGALVKGRFGPRLEGIAGVLDGVVEIVFCCEGGGE